MLVIVLYLKRKSYFNNVYFKPGQVFKINNSWYKFVNITVEYTKIADGAYFGSRFDEYGNNYGYVPTQEDLNNLVAKGKINELYINFD